MKTTTNSK